jgi:hypothetical protein
MAIHEWLISNASEKHTIEWKWGVNLFWLSYCGCNPRFPLVSMDPYFPWNVKLVPMAGEYMFKKLTDIALDRNFRPDNDILRRYLLEEWFDLRIKWLARGVFKQELARLSGL